MNIRDVDLNLLLVFDAMVRHRSVTLAAESLGLSQPAMSAAVARLRRLFGDPLFVRSGSEMRPTPRADELAAPVRLVVDTVSAEILSPTAFDPATAHRTFTILAPDIAEIRLLPLILDRLAVEAPLANLRTLALPRHAAAEGLVSGSAELAVGYFPDLHRDTFFQQKLFESPLVCIVRADHPTLGDDMTLAQYLAASHAVVRPEGREHLFDQFLGSKGYSRRVLLQISHFVSLLPIIASSDLVATVPRDLAEMCARYAPIRMLPAPIEAPPIEVHQFWHRRVHRDPGHVWLRGLVRRVLSTASP